MGTKNREKAVLPGSFQSHIKTQALLVDSQIDFFLVNLQFCQSTRLLYANFEAGRLRIKVVYLYTCMYLTKSSIQYNHTVNVLKFRTLFSFCSEIKCWFSGLKFTKCLSEKQTGETLIRLLLQEQSDLNLGCLS